MTARPFSQAMQKTANLPADGVLKSLGYLVQKDAGAPGPVRFRITSAVLDRHGDRVLSGALKTENYLNNPVLLWNHNDCVPAIGTARLIQESEEWFMEPSCDGIGELSQQVDAKVKAGTLRTCSIRFRVIEDGYDFNEEGGLDFKSVELLEVSITNIPANQEALRVKTQSPTKPKSDTPPPAPEQQETPAKDEAAGASLADVLAALKEVSGKLDKLLAAEGGAEGGEEAQPAEGEVENAEGEDDGEEMTAAEKAELKAWISELEKPAKK